MLQARIANVEDGVSRGLLTLIRRVGELQRLLAAVFAGGAVLDVKYGWSVNLRAWLTSDLGQAEVGGWATARPSCPKAVGPC